MCSVSLRHVDDRAFHFQTLWRLVLLLAIPAVCGLAMWFVASEAARLGDSVNHSLQVTLSIQQLVSDLSTVDSSFRGYLLTGKADFLAAYRLAASHSQESLHQFSQLTSDNPRQAAHAADMAALIEGQLSRFDKMIGSYQQGGLDSTSRHPDMETDGDSTRSVENVVAAIFREEESVLLQRQTAAHRAKLTLLIALSTGYGIILIIVVSLYRAARRYGEESKQTSARLIEANARLHADVLDSASQLSASEHLFSNFFRHVPAAVAMLDRELRYLHVSDRWCNILGVDRQDCINHSLDDVFPDIPEHWRAIHRRCLAGETLSGEEYLWKRSGKPDMRLRWEIRPWGEKDGIPEGISIFLEDVTDRRSMQHALRENEQTTFALLDTASQAILAVDRVGRIRIANRMASEMFGYPREELMGATLETLLPEHFRQRHRIFRTAFSDRPEPRAMGIGMDLIGIRKNGEEFPIEVSLSGVPSPEGVLAACFVSDITLRKRAEEDLRESQSQLRALAGTLLSAQDEERSKLARELHDDVTQRLAFISMELGRIATQLPDSVQEPVRNLQMQMQRVSTELHRLSRGLHPSVIADFGLSVALEDFCQEFQLAHQVSVSFELPTEEPPIDSSSATCLFRIAQEGMRNAVVHGHARVIQVSVSRNQDWVTLRIQDDGVGFSTGELRRRTGLGVISMQERIRHVKGTLSLASQPGKGAVILASVPVPGGRHDTDLHSARG